MMNDMFSELFDDMFFGGRRMPTPAQHGYVPMSCDVQEYPDHYELDMDLAGYRKEDIQAELKNGYLTVRAKRSTVNDEHGENHLIRSERFTGECSRTFRVGEHVRKEDISAAYEDGVLKLAIPKKTEQPELSDYRIMIQ